MEQPPEFYDWAFEGKEHWRFHYSESRYYPLWTVVADRVVRSGAARVLDIGCGPGQVASLLRDQGIPNYLGLDFSPARVRHARAICPEYAFEAVDVFSTPLLEEGDYDVVLLLEFLEHIERDREVLGRIREGTRVIASVPNFPSAGHVRHFDDAAAVEARYGSSLTSLTVDRHAADPLGKSYFLIDGVA